MKDRVPIVIVAAAAVLVVVIAVLMRRSVTPPPPVAASRVEEAAPKGDYSDRVAERLRMLRAEHQHRQEADDGDDTEAAPGGARAGGEQPVRGGAPRPQRRDGSGLEFPVPNAEVGRSFGELRHTLTSHPSREKRVEAAREIGASDDADALSVLIEAMNDRDPTVRVAVVEALGDHLEEITAETLAPALKDSDANVRFEALTLIGLMDAPEAAEMLTDLAEDPDEDVRDLAAEVRHVLATAPTPFPEVTPPRWRPWRAKQRRAGAVAP